MCCLVLSCCVQWQLRGGLADWRIAQRAPSVCYYCYLFMTVNAAYTNGITFDFAVRIEISRRLWNTFEFWNEPNDPSGIIDGLDIRRSNENKWETNGKDWFFSIFMNIHLFFIQQALHHINNNCIHIRNFCVVCVCVVNVCVCRVFSSV